MTTLLSLMARKELYSRIEHVILTDPMPSKTLAQRFGVRADVIRRLAKKLGVKLPHGELLSSRAMSKLKKK